MRRLSFLDKRGRLRAPRCGCAWVALLLCTSVVAQQPKPKPKLPADVQQVVDLASAAPPEFAANALLRLVESGKITDRATKRDFIEQAFDFAGRAQHPYPLTSVPGTGVDTHAGFLSSALKLHLDALSLQTRAVHLMLGLDNKEARELFARIVRPTPNPSSCEDTLVPDLSAYYEALGWVVRDAFTAEERQKEEPVRFMTAQLSRMSSQAELPAAAQMLMTTAWTSSQLQILLGVYITKLDSLPTDPRVFSYYVRQVESEIVPLAGVARHEGVSTEELSQAYRKYLVTNFTAPRCSDGTNGGMVTGEAQLQIFGDGIRGELPPLTAEEMTSSKVESAAKPEKYWGSDVARQIYQACLALRMSPDGKMLSEAERNTRDWKRQLSDLLNTVADWKASDENTEADYYHQKAIVYEALLDLAPAGDMRSRIMQDYVGFLTGANLMQQDPVAWYWHAHSTLVRLQGSATEESRKLAAAFRASGNVILELQSLLDEVAPEYSMFPK